MTLSPRIRSSRIYLSVFLISASILMLELVLTRIFSVKLYYHYAFMVISLALLGSGASGVYVYLFPKLFRPARLQGQLFMFSWLFAASIPLTLGFILRLDFQFDFTLRQLWRIVLLYGIPAVPFFLGGLFVAVVLFFPDGLVGMMNRVRGRFAQGRAVVDKTTSDRSLMVT